VLCSLWLQGCRSSFQVTSGEPVLKKPCKTSGYEQVPGQVLVPNVQLPMRHFAVIPDAAPSWQQALSTTLEETDAKHAARPTAQTTSLFSEQQLNDCDIRLKSLKTEDFSLVSSLQVQLHSSEQACAVLRAEKEALITENAVLRKDIAMLKQNMQALVRIRLPAEVFGAEEWRQYFGEVGEVPPYPEHLIDTLNSPCPFWARKSVKNTHLLVLIPSRVAGQPFSLNLLEKLIDRPQGGGHPTRYRCYYDGVQRVLGAQSPGGSYWVLMTREVLEGSRNKDYASQKSLVATRAGETELPYELPGALEAATVILSHYVRSEERLYTDNPWTWTRCRELVDNRLPVIVGGFSSGGLGVGSDGGRSYYGVSCLRKF
jgi:hypothetical protein